MDGKNQLENLKNYYAKKDEHDSNRNTIQPNRLPIPKDKKKGFDGLYELVNVPGVKLTQKAKNKFSKIMMNRAKLKTKGS